MSYSEETLRRYLVGELPAPEQTALETKYFADRELYDRVCEAENDLINDYLSGKLSLADCERFERHYLSTPEKRQQVEFSRAMRRSLAQNEPVYARTPEKRPAGWWSSLLGPPGRPRLALGFSLALAGLLALSGAWLLMNTLRLRRELADARTVATAQRQRELELKRQVAEERSQSMQLTAELERTREQLRIEGEHSNSGVITLLLSAGLLREGSKQNTFRVPASADVIEFQLPLKSLDYRTYDVAVKTAEGNPVWHRKRVSLTGQGLQLRARARLFPSGDYILSAGGISGGKVEEVSQFYFRIVKR